MFIYFLSFFVGIIAGCITGFFGGGSGLIIIPSLLYILTLVNFDHVNTMQVALGTGFAITSTMAIFSLYGHLRNGNVYVPLVKKLWLSLFIFTLVGAFIATSIPGQILIKIFGILVLLLVFWLLVAKEPVQITAPGFLSRTAVSAFIGVMCGSLCINPFTLAYLRKIGLSMHKAIGTTVALGTALALGGIIMFVIKGWKVAGLPQYHLGFVDIRLWLPFTISSSIAAPIAARMNRLIPAYILKYSYCLLLFIIGLKMLF